MCDLTDNKAFFVDKTFFRLWLLGAGEGMIMLQETLFRERHKPVVVFLMLELVNRNIFSVGGKGGMFCPDR